MKEQIRNASGQGLRYRTPNVKVIDVKAQGVLCGSPYGENTEKFTLGDNYYDESDWD